MGLEIVGAFAYDLLRTPSVSAPFCYTSSILCALVAIVLLFMSYGHQQPPSRPFSVSAPFCYTSSFFCALVAMVLHFAPSF